MTDTADALVLEDNATTRAWLVECVHAAYPALQVHEAGSVEEALHLVDNTRFALALLDLGLPDGSGVEVIEKIRLADSGTYMVVVTLSDDDADLFRALKAGARGYILKDVDREKVISFLTGIDQGEVPVSNQMAARMVARFNREGEQLAAASLAPREIDVLRLTAKGYSASDCAELLGLTQNTAKSYLKNVYQKLGVSSRAEAAVEAVRLGLVDP